MVDLTGLILYEVSLIWFPLCFLGVFMSSEYVLVYEILTFSTFPMDLHSFDRLCKGVGVFCFLVGLLAWIGYFHGLY